VVFAGSSDRELGEDQCRAIYLKVAGRQPLLEAWELASRVGGTGPNTPSAATCPGLRAFCIYGSRPRITPQPTELPVLWQR
jgi:hypothetical protein